jgi:integrase
MPVNRRIPSYRKHSTRNHAIVKIEGKVHYLGPYGSRESRDLYDELVAAHLERRCDDDPVLVVEVLAKFWAHAKVRYRKSGKGRLGAAVNYRPVLRLVRQKYGNTPVRDFGPRKLQSIIDDMVAADWSRGYIQSQLSKLKTAFKWAASKELIPFDVYNRLTTVNAPRYGETNARETPPVEPVEDALVAATIPWMPEPVGDMVRFQRFTGARPGEVCTIQPRDVDRSGDIWVYRVESHKTRHHGKHRRIFIGPQAQDVLRPYLLRPDCTFCFKPKWIRSGNKYTTDTYRRAIHRACERRCRDEKLPLVKWSPNQLRHSAATAVRCAFGIETASSVLGHSGLKVTELYAEHDDRRAIEAAKRLG